jgi:small GTP-binding protein
MAAAKSNGSFFNIFDGFIDSFRGAPKKSSIKIALIGDGSTGKTSYFNRITCGDDPDYKFSKAYDATRGCNICQIEFLVNSHPVTVHLFDTAGQEKFGTLRDSYLMGVDGVILMYDITDKTTKQNILSKWIPELKRILHNSQSTSYVPIMVVGNKHDKIDALVSAANEYVGIRVSSLTGAYTHVSGEVNHCFISVKADENLMIPINWLLTNILQYSNVSAKKSAKVPYISYCN